MMIPLLFPKRLPKGKNRSGFTLIEMAVVIVIVGVVISIVATVLPSLIQSAKIKKARAILEKIDYAIEGSITANGQLPFADSTTDGSGDSGTYFGNLPYRDLGLSSGDDAWGNRLKYGVYDSLTTSTPSTFCDALKTASSAPFNAAQLHINQSGTLTNMAYVIVSGGPKDLDNDNSFFDGLNDDDDAEFDDPDQIMSTTYDDLMMARSFAEISGIQGCGGGGEPPGPTGVENTDALCSDTKDNDGDGKPDCQDQDCCGPGVSPGICPDGCPPPDVVKIVTVPDPITGGTVGQTNYSHTFQATGGSGYYYWYLDSITPAISELSINLTSGNLYGTVNVCEAAYTVNVRVEDRHDSSRTDSHPFTLNVNNGTLSISPAPKGGGETNPDFTVNLSTFSQVFTASGPYVGDIEWTMSWVGTDPGGFQINSDDGKFWKSSSTTVGTYTFTITATDSTCSTNTKATTSYTIVITPSGTGSPYSADLVAEWRLDECSWDGTAGEVKDSGDHILDGTAVNGADTIGSGKICGAGFFDGSNDYISVDSTDDLKRTTAFSIALWVKVNANASDWVRLAGKGNSTNRNYGLWLATNGTILFQIYSDGGYGNAQTTVTVNDGNWHHVAGVYDLTTMKVYMDNVERKSIDYSQNPRTSDDPFTMGYAGFHTCLNGCLDEVMLLHKALPATSETETSVDTIFNLTRSSCSGSCYTDPVAEYRMENFPWDGTANEVNDSGTGASHGLAAAHGTGALPAQTTPSGGKVCRAGVFARIDANNGGYLDLGDPADGDLDPGTDPWTISAWVKWDGSASENIIYNKESLYEARISGGYLNYAWRPHWAWDGGTSFPVTADTWTYATTAYDGTRQILYKDGVQVYSRSQTGAIGSNGNKLLIGARGSGSPYNFFGGMVDEIKIYNRALAENEIKADMDETRDCSADSVVITTASLPNGTINNPYSHTITATGGTAPYGWELLSSGIPGLSIVPNTGELNGTTDKCAGDYAIVVRVTDAESRTDERSFTLTVENGTLTISPSSPKTFNCTTSDFYRDFSVSGARMGPLENWTITWLGTNPGGFEVIKTGDATAKFRKISTSTAGNGYQFKLTANDSTCADNTIVSGYYTLNINGDGTGTPYYAGHQGEWWLDETEAGTAPSGKDLTDHSGRDNHGTASGGVTYGVQGKVWGALQFDGSSGYVDCGNNTSLDIDTNPADVPQDFTIGAWVKAGAIPVTDFNGYFVDKGTGGFVDGYGLAIIGNQFAFITDGNGVSGGKSTLLADDTVTAGTWYHIAGVRESGVKKLYVNKILQSATPTEARELSDTSTQLVIGKPDADDGYFQGTVDEVVFYNRALSQSEITDLYNKASLVAYYKMDETSGDIYDYSGKNNHGTNYGADYGANGRVGYALDFDGADYVNVGNNGDLTQANISIATWVKATQLDTWNGIITNKPDANHGINLQIGTAQNIAALVGNGSACTYVKTTWAPSVDTWYHVVITHNGSDDNNILYVDGNKEAEKTYVLAYSLPVDTIIGRFYTPSLPFNGLIDEVRIYDRVLSGDEVKELYNKGIEEGG